MAWEYDPACWEASACTTWYLKGCSAALTFITIHLEGVLCSCESIEIDLSVLIDCKLASNVITMCMLRLDVCRHGGL